MAATTRTVTGEQERAQSFMAMGFSAVQAFLLAATQSQGRHVELDLVRRMLDAGCDRELIMRICL
jgi:uncharacterized protein YoaH (UPF0181 family)